MCPEEPASPLCIPRQLQMLYGIFQNSFKIQFCNQMYFDINAMSPIDRWGVVNDRAPECEVR